MNIPQVQTTNNNKRYYGLNDGGFSRGMNTTPYSGQGLQLAQNLFIKNGIISKMYGDTELHDFGSDVRVIDIFEYQKADGAFQVVCFIDDGSSVKLRAIEEDGTVITPSSGAGDLDFVDTTISFEQIAITGYITSKTKTAVYTWDGTTLTAMAVTRTNVLGMSKEGRRLTLIREGIAEFSRSDENPLTSIDGGTDTTLSGNYTPNISGFPVGIYSGSTGTLIAFTSGFELHNIIEYTDGSGITGDTRDKSFQYRGDGISKADQFLFGSYYGYAITEKGLIRIDPATGKAVNLMEEDKDSKSYRIKDYFDKWDKQFAVIGYSPKDEMIVLSMLKGVSDSNDICICYHEPTKNFYLRRVNYGSMGSVNRVLYSGSSVDGKVYKCFDRSSYSDGNGSPQTLRAVSEWDKLGDFGRVKLPIDFFTHFKGLAGQDVFLNLYINGEVSTPIATFSYSAEDKINTSGLIGDFGDYILGVGRSDDINFSEYYSKDTFNVPIHTFCWEIVETSSQDFNIFESVIEYINLHEIESGNSFANSLFNV